MKNIILLIATCIILFAFSGGNGKEIICTKNAPTPIGPYSQAVKAGGIVYVSGQIALKPDGNLDTSSVENECRQVLENIKFILEAASLKMSDIHKTKIYTTNLKHFSKINEIYKSYFSSNFPARETVQVSALPKGAHIEISVEAN